MLDWYQEIKDFPVVEFCEQIEYRINVAEDECIRLKRKLDECSARRNGYKAVSSRARKVKKYFCTQIHLLNLLQLIDGDCKEVDTMQKCLSEISIGRLFSDNNIDNWLEERVTNEFANDKILDSEIYWSTLKKTYYEKRDSVFLQVELKKIRNDLLQKKIITKDKNCSDIVEDYKKIRN